MIVTFPFTVSVTAAACVRELAAELATKFSEVQELSLFIVYVAPAATEIAGKLVLAVPPMVLAAPLKVMVFAPPLKVPPLFVQFPATVALPESVTITPALI